MAVCDPCGGDVRAAMADLGYEAWCQVGVGDSPPVPISLALYSREEPPLQFLLQLEGNAGNVVEHIFAETLPDAMELLARWAPLARHGPDTPGPRTGRPEDVSGRPEDGRTLAEDVLGRLGENPGRTGDTAGDRPAGRRPAVTGSPVAADPTAPPER